MKLLIPIALLLLAGCAQVETKSAHTTAFPRTKLPDYTAWEKATPRPVEVAPTPIVTCVETESGAKAMVEKTVYSVQLDEFDDVCGTIFSSEPGNALIYLNSEAKEGYSSKHHRYPPGSKIVVELLDKANKKVGIAYLEKDAAEQWVHLTFSPDGKTQL